MDRTGQAVLACCETGRALAADLGAAERGLGSVDGLDDVEDRDVTGRASEAVATPGAWDRVEDPGARERLEVLGEIRGRHAVVLGEAAGGQGGVGGQHRGEGDAMEAPLDTFGHAHFSDINYPG